jgi:hypothetical protein
VAVVAIRSPREPKRTKHYETNRLLLPLAHACGSAWERMQPNGSVQDASGRPGRPTVHTGPRGDGDQSEEADDENGAYVPESRRRNTFHGVQACASRLGRRPPEC